MDIRKTVKENKISTSLILVGLITIIIIPIIIINSNPSTTPTDPLGDPIIYDKIVNTSQWYNFFDSVSIPSAMGNFEQYSYIENVHYVRDRYDVLEIRDTSKNSGITLVKNLGNKQYGSYEFWFSISNSKKSATFRFTDHGDLAVFSVYYNVANNGQGWLTMTNHYYRTFGSPDLLYGFSAYSGWYCIKIDFEFTNGEYKGLAKNTANVYLNTYLTFENFQIRGLDFSKFKVYTGSSDADFSLYLGEFIDTTI